MDIPKVSTNDQTPWWLELGFPVFALALAPILLWAFPILTWATSLWVHEFGHAFAGWFGGRAATPFVGWTSLSGDRSWTVTICFTVLLGILGYKSWEGRSPFLVLTFILMFLAQLYYRFAMSNSQLGCWISFMGIGGEFWISTWFLVAYHYRMPEATHWHVFRYVGAFVGAFTFYNIYSLWLQVASGKRDVPYGSLWGDSGDMDNLRDVWLWSPDLITSRYLTLANACIALMMVNYLFQVVRVAYRKSP